MRRRAFLQMAGSFAVSAALPLALGACARSPAEAGFPQGVAAGDPRPDSLVLWTRAEPRAGWLAPVEVTLEVALDVDFSSLLLQRRFAVDGDSDHTLRVRVEDLQPDTLYHYRFRSGEQTSRHGRAWTAPARDAARDFRFAFLSCQERCHGFYTAWRQLLADDRDDDPIRLVLHLGDFIYETRNEPLQSPLDEHLEPLAGDLRDRHGQPRELAPFEDGGVTGDGVEYARTLADYRQLYRQYLADPDLQAARARWAFAHVWDDHEFSDDCWQSEANYSDAGADSSTDEPSQRRRVAASQAWFEYLPVDFTRPDDVPEALWPARAFSFVEVQDSPNARVDDDNLADNPDNRAAIDSLRLYRTLRYGALAEFLLTDSRSYRSDHAIPEDLSGNLPVFLHPRLGLPLAAVEQLDAGRTANGGDPDLFLLLGQIVINPRRTSPPGTLLGAAQKAWLKAALQASDASWKLWANPVPLLRLRLNLSALGLGLPDLIASGDSWDGYPGERRELAAFVRDAGIDNLVSLAGDLHAHLAGLVMDDYDGDDPQAVLTELVTAATSSASQFAAVERFSRREQPSERERQLRRLITYDARDAANPADRPLVRNLNNSLINGALAGLAAADVHSREAVEAARDPLANGHLAFADTDAHGYGLVSVSADALAVELVGLGGIGEDRAVGAETLRYRARFRVPRVAAGEAPRLEGPEIEGAPPFPLDL